MTDGRPIADYRSADGQCRCEQLESRELILFRFTGHMREADARQLAPLWLEPARRRGRPYRCLIDVSALESAEPAARNLMHNTIEGPDLPCSRIATCGGSFFITTMFTMYARIARVPFQVFATRAEAEAWLLSDAPGAPT